MVFVVEVDASPEVFGGIGFVDDEFGGISTDGVDGLFDGGESISRNRGVWERFWGCHKTGLKVSSVVSMESGLGVEFCIKNATLTYILTYILLETPLETRMDIE